MLRKLKQAGDAIVNRGQQLRQMSVAQEMKKETINYKVDAPWFNVGLHCLVTHEKKPFSRSLKFVIASDLGSLIRNAILMLSTQTNGHWLPSMQL